MRLIFYCVSAALGWTKILTPGCKASNLLSLYAEGAHLREAHDTIERAVLAKAVLHVLQRFFQADLHCIRGPSSHSNRVF